MYLTYIDPVQQQLSYILIQTKGMCARDAGRNTRTGASSIVIFGKNVVEVFPSDVPYVGIVIKEKTISYITSARRIRSRLTTQFCPDTHFHDQITNISITQFSAYLSQVPVPIDTIQYAWTSMNCMLPLLTTVKIFTSIYKMSF